MNGVTVVLSAIAFMFASSAFAQPPGGGGQKVGLATSLQRGYASIKMNLTQEAEKMPEPDYTFKPGSTPDVRPFGKVIAHVAQAQFGQCSAVNGVANLLLSGGRRRQ